MFNGLDHVVIAVKDLDASVKAYETIYGRPVSDEDSNAVMRMAYFRFGDSYVELVTGVGEGGPITKRLDTQGEGVHLIAMRVDDLAATVAELREKGVRLIGDPGAGQPITGQVFIHPAAAGGVLTQLVQR